MQVHPLHSYRAHYVPVGMADEDVEAHAHVLPSLRLKAPNAPFAAASAHHVTGRPVHRVERVEGGAA